MQVPIVQLSQSSQTAIKKILNASKEKTTLCRQIQMTNYYAFLHSKPQADKIDYAKLLLHK